MHFNCDSEVPAVGTGYTSTKYYTNDAVTANYFDFENTNARNGIFSQQKNARKETLDPNS